MSPLVAQLGTITKVVIKPRERKEAESSENKQREQYDAISPR